ARELGEIAAKYGTPRRTVLLESEARPAAEGRALASGADAAKSAAGKAPALALEIADDPCWAILSASGNIARTANAEPLTEGGQRARHDVFRSVVRTTARGELGAVTSAGRMVRLQTVDLPVLAPVSGLPNLSGGLPAKDFVTLEKGEALVALVPLDLVVACGTEQGVVKRVAPDYPLNREDWEMITLKPGDRVIGAAPASDQDALVFISEQAQLLHYPASNVRPQGRTAGGMAGIKLGPGDKALHFGVVADGDEGAVVVTISGSRNALPGTAPGSAKVTPFAEYPAKGRATGGVRAHRYLKGEDVLLAAWAGHGPAKASSNAGVARSLPTEHGRRDGSGVPLSQAVEAVGPSFG
ncbi:MAG: DNA topoisomerase IV, partial [Sinomonas sp.]|nr:DNA topoisomerase IV [Sinomonas sp.]